MPELPEVESTRKSLTHRLEGATVLGVRLGKPLRWPLGVATERLVGRTAGALRRRGKYLWLPLSDGASPAEPPGLLLHLGMSGSLAWWPAGVEVPPEGPHDHFDLDTSAGLLRLTDPRRFGAVVWSEGIELEPARSLLARLGPEPFDPALTEETFHAALHERRAPIKAVLLGGEVIVGAGNIYACEALFHAGLDPRTSSHQVSRPKARRLLAAVRQVLARALEVGGTTLRNYRDADGSDGRFQFEVMVYGREGEPCRVCATPIKRLVMGQRSTFWCPRCQPRR